MVQQRRNLGQEITPQCSVCWRIGSGGASATGCGCGGVRLAKPASEITLYDVVRTTEESFAMAECFEAGDIECPLVDSCALNGVLYKALNAFFEVLQDHTIEDLVRSQPHMRALLGMLDSVDAPVAGTA